MNQNWVQERLACSVRALSQKLRAEVEMRVRQFNQDANRGLRGPVGIEPGEASPGRERLLIKIDHSECGYFSYPQKPQGGNRDFIRAGRVIPQSDPMVPSRDWLHYEVDPHWDKNDDKCVLKVTHESDGYTEMMGLDGTR